MKSIKWFLITALLSLSLLLVGCNMFQERTRPAPVRPQPAPKKQTQQPPTKEIRGLKSISKAEFLERVNQTEKAIKVGNWNKANQETNRLGADMARYRPKSPNGQTLKEISKFNIIYSKLQANVKARNRKQALNNIRSLREAVHSIDPKR
ncbi:MAG TPA: DUF4363 family protein [Bacillota bacterium]|mgnify:CR=1 FL=1|jgi:hypothetical protein|nr:DUF4363 family protein [Bacillota bacterium]HOL09293.1 DUF4363 family protein [Bacillota bacterium]HPO96956.1 DUF4363 family protein [Bacillota bacterium]